jgi:hypothetical protein
VAVQKFLQNGANDGTDGTFQQVAYASVSGTPASPSVFGAAGPSHSSGLVPDPGSTAHSPPFFLGDDAAFHPQSSIVVAGTLVSVNTYTSSQTITIPSGATKAFARMYGSSGGGQGGTAVCAMSAAANGQGGGPGGYLEKYLTGLTSGNTIVYTQGAVGAAGAGPHSGGGGNAGNSTLASGTQTISTLTCNGGKGGGTNNGQPGTATGGDTNITGSASLASPPTVGVVGVCMQSVGGFGGNTSGSNGAAGNPGGLIIDWYS